MPEKALNIDKTIYANEKLSKRGKFAILKSLLVDYVENGMYKTALNAIENNQRAFKNDEFLLSLAKDVSYRLGDFEKALGYNKKLLDLKNIKDHSELGYIAANMAQQALENEKYDIVKNLIKKGKKFNKNCESIYLAEAKLNYEQDNLSKAKSLFMKALNINPDIIDYISDDILNVYAQNYDDLIKDLNKVVKNNLYNPYIHIFLAKIYKKNENLEEAIEELHEAILYKPESHYILLLMLDVYIEMGDWEKVVEMKEEMKDLESSRKFVCKECGKRYHELTWYCDNCKSWGKVVTKL
jgi:lipopolysaccharide biosynthesis regulator YciM